jgi:hypothetical protein
VAARLAGDVDLVVPLQAPDVAAAAIRAATGTSA